MTEAERLADAIDPRVERPSQQYQLLTNTTREDLIAAADALRAMGWRKIESAPKDGTQILTYSPRAEEHGFQPVRLNYWLHGGWRKTNEQHWPPTLWQPLPSPPEEKEG